MSITKIAVLVSASIVTAGSTAAVATRDKWWPKTEESTPVTDGGVSGTRATNTGDGLASQSGPTARDGG